MREILGCKISAELRISHQIPDALQYITLRIKAELLCRYLIAPFNATLCIQQHHSIGAGLQRRQNIVESLISLLHLLNALANPATHAHTGLTPDAHQVRHIAQLRLAQPTQQARSIPAIHQPPDPAAYQSPHQCRQTLLQHARARRKQIGPDQPYQNSCNPLRSQQSKTTPPHICFPL